MAAPYGAFDLGDRRFHRPDRREALRDKARAGASPLVDQPIVIGAHAGDFQLAVLQPAECFSGHCGVDLGGEVWGEPVHAVHDGVVDRVQLNANNERGGIYVKISHRNGTVFTWYFHLAAVPRWAEEGAKVKAGDVIGLLGDTGVKRSGPHLHFQISVKPSAALGEQYIDPEPLIALWPLWVPEDQGGKKLTIEEPPAVPRGAHRKRKKKKEKVEDPPAAVESHAAVEEPAAD